MNEKEIILRLFSYNSRVRKKYLDAMEQTDWAEIEKNRESSFYSIKGVFLHVLGAYDWWIAYAFNDRLADFKRPEADAYTSMQAIREKESETDKTVMSFVERVSPDMLDEKFTFHRGTRTITLTIRDMLLHLVEEELQHRGEINCMFWQMGKDPPVTGYDD